MTADGGASATLKIVSITPAPTESERAAIAHAVERLHAEIWPQRADASGPPPSPRWRYAGRRWNRRTSYAGWI